MTIDPLIKVVVTIPLIEMACIGFGVIFVDLLGVSRNGRFVLQAGLANYVCVSAAQPLPTGFSKFSDRCCWRWLGPE